MRTKEQLLAKLYAHIGGCSYIYHDWGYVAWKCSTGDNVEIAFIEVKEKGKGHATQLLREMVSEIQPFHSVFVFRLASNESAGHFYRKIGFQETPIVGLYQGGDAVLGVVTFKQLCQNLLIQ